MIVVRRLDRLAPTVKVSDVTPDPRRWENICFADYLDAYGVRVEPIEDDYIERKKAWYDIVPGDWTDPDPQAIGRPRPVWP